MVKITTWGKGVSKTAQKSEVFYGRPPNVTFDKLHLASLVTHSQTGASLSVIYDSFNTPIDDTNLDLWRYLYST